MSWNQQGFQFESSGSEFKSAQTLSNTQNFLKLEGLGLWHSDRWKLLTDFIDIEASIKCLTKITRAASAWKSAQYGNFPSCRQDDKRWYGVKSTVLWLYCYSLHITKRWRNVGIEANRPNRSFWCFSENVCSRSFMKLAPWHFEYPRSSLPF